MLSGGWGYGYYFLYNSINICSIICKNLYYNWKVMDGMEEEEEEYGEYLHGI